LGFDNGLDEVDTLEEANTILSGIHGLYDFERGEKKLEALIHKTDIPTLDFIPETPELHQLDRMIGTKNRREFWLLDNVVNKLKTKYDVIIFDCSPNWNNLVTNAIAACDLLISPLECKINNYKNFPAFKLFIEGFKKETQLSFTQVFVPTRFSAARKLSKDIKSFYSNNAPNCTTQSIREGIKGEEAVAQNKSLPESAPTSIDAQEMREVISEIWEQMLTIMKKKENSKALTQSARESANV
jgi:chromosome partitioning protein